VSDPGSGIFELTRDKPKGKMKVSDLVSSDSDSDVDSDSIYSPEFGLNLSSLTKKGWLCKYNEKDSKTKTPKFYSIEYPYLKYYRDKSYYSSRLPMGKILLREGCMVDGVMEDCGGGIDISRRFRINKGRKLIILETSSIPEKQEWVDKLQAAIFIGNPAKRKKGTTYKVENLNKEQFTLSISLGNISLFEASTQNEVWSRQFWQLRGTSKHLLNPSVFLLDFAQYGGRKIFKICSDKVSSAEVENVITDCIKTIVTWRGTTGVIPEERY